jgi:hypothetical protein
MGILLLAKKKGALESLRGVEGAECLMPREEANINFGFGGPFKQ